MVKAKMITKHTQSKEAKEKERKHELFRTNKWDRTLETLTWEVQKKQDEFIAELEKEKKAKEEEQLKLKAERVKKDAEKQAAKEAARAAQATQQKAGEKQA